VGVSTAEGFGVKILTIASVNLRRFLRERSNIFFVFIFPLALILVLGATFGGGAAPRIGVVQGSDPGPFEKQVIEQLESVEGYELRHFDSESEMVYAVERGQVSAGVLFPDDYDGRLESGLGATIGFIARPEGGTHRLALQAAIADQAARIGAARAVAEQTGVGPDQAMSAVTAVESELGELDVPVSVLGERIFGDDVEQFDLGASSQLVLFTFLTGLTASAAMIQSRQLGVSRRMLSTPTPVGSIVTGEAVGRFAVVLFQGAYIMAATWFIFDVDWGEPIGAFALLLVFSLVGAGAGLLMGSIFSNDQQAGGVGVVTGLGLAALGGCMVPLEFFSPTMRSIAMLTPHAWALDGFSQLLRYGGGVGDVIANLAVLSGFAAVLLSLAAWRLRIVLTR